MTEDNPATIAFEVYNREAAKAWRADPREDEHVMYLSVSLARATQQKGVEGLQGPLDIVIPGESARVLFDYPIGTTGPTEEERAAGGWIFALRADTPRGFTREGLAVAIADQYREIYRQEDRDCEEAHKEVSPQHPCLMNRGQSEGRYAIWGHVLEDLSLVDVEKRAGCDYYIIGVDS